LPAPVAQPKTEVVSTRIKRPDVMEERRTVSVSLDAFAPKKISSYVDVLTNAASWATLGILDWQNQASTPLLLRIGWT
jgi:hypothetical protein